MPSLHFTRSVRPLSRGVYLAPWRGRHGEAVLLAIDRHGRCLTQCLILDARERGVAAAVLRDLLDHEDPAPAAQLRVI